MIYKSEKFGDAKVYAVATNFAGTVTVKEFKNGCRRSELTLAADQAAPFIFNLEKAGFVQQKR
jgi:hypothetical protein